jgi:flagellar basal-body rod protein FlgB
MMQGMFDNGSLPVLERMVQFTEARHKVLTHNIANLSTPYFKPKDLNTESFQASLREAIDKRRSTATPSSGQLQFRDTDQVKFEHDRLLGMPTTTNDGVLFHDQNNRDVVRVMQDLAENTLAHNTAIEMIRNQFALMQMAIRERL